MTIFLHFLSFLDKLITIMVVFNRQESSKKHPLSVGETKNWPLLTNFLYLIFFFKNNRFLLHITGSLFLTGEQASLSKEIGRADKSFLENCLLLHVWSVASSPI